MSKLHELMQMAIVFGLSSDSNMYGEEIDQRIAEYKQELENL